MRKLALMAGALAMTAPALVVATPASAKTVKTWRGKDGRYYCRKSNGTVGLVVGGVGGALVGRAIDTRGDRTLGTVVGAVGGALAGREIERRVSTKRCR